MRKVSPLVTLWVFFFVFIVCGCNFTEVKNHKYRKYDLKNTCQTPKNYSVSHATKVTLLSSHQEKNNKITLFDILTKWKNLPLSIFKNSTSISFGCRTDFNKYYEAALRSEFYALKMFDASAKLPSGILNGNVNQYGDYDECMEVPKAQYCLVEIDFSPIWKMSGVKYQNLVHSHYSIRETFKDPGHRVPGFSFVRWAFCIPKSCSSVDLTSALEENLAVRARIRSGLCQPSVKLKDKLTFGDYAARVYFIMVFLAVSVSTFLYNKYTYKDKWFKILRIFSLQHNFEQLTTFSENKNEFKSVHGVRCLSALALLMAHKTMALLYNPYINRTWMAEAHSMKWSVIGRNAIIYTDCFLLISGLLNANTLFVDLDSKDKIKFKDKVISRLFRILPSLTTVILFCTYILPLMGSGPLWPLVINHHSVLCKRYMWRNTLLVHNYFGFENMCLTHTHQLGIDMQLFLVTPIFVYLIWKLKTKGVLAVVFISLMSTGLRFWKTLEHNLSYVVHFGIPVSRMFDTANYSYILPTHRATIYLIGVFLAYFLRICNTSQLTKKQQLLMWSLTYILGLATWFGPIPMSVKGYEYYSFYAAVYSALSPITWGMTVAWVIYATEMGYRSWLTPILTWKYFQIFTKIAYGVYLVQFPVFFYNVGITRHVGEFKNYMMLPPVETGIILLISTILTLCIEMPFQNVYKLFVNAKTKNAMN